MSDSQTPRAEAIPAVDFSASYIETYKEGGTIADLAEKLERSIEQVRAKRQSLAAQVKLLGGEIPKLARMPRSGNGATGYIYPGIGSVQADERYVKVLMFYFTLFTIYYYYLILY